MNETVAAGARGALATTLVGLLAVSAPAEAQDHLKCFKVRDASTFRVAAVDVDALAAGYGLESCTVLGRAKRVCVPADATVTSIDEGTDDPTPGETLEGWRMCYRLRCPKVELAPAEITDRFGTRTVSAFKAVELCTPVNLAPPSLDDSFDGDSLDPAWNVLHPGLVTVSVSGGALHLTPTASGAPDIWYNGGEGPLVYKSVTGDFDVVATLTTRNPSIPADPPPPEYRLAGLMARDPASTPASSNTVHVALGAGSTGQGTSYEYKSTDDSVSDWAATPTASPAGQVRLVRSGSTFEMHWRPTTMAGWTMIQSFNRPDLPATLQVGPMVYSVDAPASIEALFDDIVFQ